MIKLIAGIFLLIAPFLLVSLFTGKKRGFVYVLLFSIIFQTLLAFFTQFFGVFYYAIILAANLLAVFGLLTWFLVMRGNEFFASPAVPPADRQDGARICLQKNPLLSIDWVIFAVAIISALTLYQIHYNYTGKFNVVGDILFQYHEAKNMKYIYPYFSDEWYAVSLVKEAISNNSLPTKNPFDNSFFVNPEIVFHSFIAEIMLFLGLDPLTQYTALSVFINTLIIVLAYLFLRLSNVSRFASAISSLSILYITSAANLPGIWNLIPITMGIVLSLIGFCFLSLNNFKMAALSFLFGALFYPPLFIFSAVGVFAYLFDYLKTNGRNN